MLALTGRTVDGVLADIRAVAAALDLADEGDELTAGLRSRLARLRRAGAGGACRVLCVEWLEPLYLAGHWVPDLVAAAGGIDVGAEPGAHSAIGTWSAAAARRPDLIVVMLCGFGVERARRELDRLADPRLSSVLGAVPVWMLDGNAYTSRPGPRIVDGAERLQAAMAGDEGPGSRAGAGRGDDDRDRAGRHGRRARRGPRTCSRSTRHRSASISASRASRRSWPVCPARTRRRSAACS